MDKDSSRYDQPFCLGAWRIDPMRLSLTDPQGKAIPLAHRAMSVLVELARAKGGVVRKYDLMGAVWGPAAITDGALSQAIFEVRDAFGDDPKHPQVIETIRGVGFRLVPAVLAAEEDVVPTATHAASQQGAPAAAVGRRSNRPLLAAVIACVLIIASSLVYRWGGNESRAPLPTTGAFRVAVLPFEALDAESRANGAVDAIAPAIASALTLSGLSVLAPTQTNIYRGDARVKAARELGSIFVISGEVSSNSGQYNAIARLEDSRTGVVLVSYEIQDDVRSGVPLPERVAARIAGHGSVLGMLPRGAPEPAVIAAIYQSQNDFDFESYRLESYRKSVPLAEDYPDDPLAQFSLALYSGWSYWSLPINEVEGAMLRARQAEARARALAPEWGQAYTALEGLVPRTSWVLIEKHLKRGLEIDPGETNVTWHLAHYYWNAGRISDAEYEYRTVTHRDPFNRQKAAALYGLQLQLGDTEDATAILKRAERLWPGDKLFAVSRFEQSDFRDPRSDARRMLEDPFLTRIIEPPGTAPVVAQMLRALDSGKPEDADTAIAKCNDGWTSVQATVTCLSGMTALGRKDEAFQYAHMLYRDPRGATPEETDKIWLRREVTVFITGYLFRADLVALRADARFTQLVENVGLMDYWRETGVLPDVCKTESAPFCVELKRRIAQFGEA